MLESSADEAVGEFTLYPPMAAVATVNSYFASQGLRQRASGERAVSHLANARYSTEPYRSASTRSISPSGPTGMLEPTSPDLELMRQRAMRTREDRERLERMQRQGGVHGGMYPPSVPTISPSLHAQHQQQHHHYNDPHRAPPMETDPADAMLDAIYSRPEFPGDMARLLQQQRKQPQQQQQARYPEYSAVSGFSSGGDPSIFSYQQHHQRHNFSDPYAEYSEMAAGSAGPSYHGAAAKPFAAFRTGALPRSTNPFEDDDTLAKRLMETDDVDALLNGIQRPGYGGGAYRGSDGGAGPDDDAPPAAVLAAQRMLHAAPRRSFTPPYQPQYQQQQQQQQQPAGRHLTAKELAEELEAIMAQDTAQNGGRAAAEFARVAAVPMRGAVAVPPLRLPNSNAHGAATTSHDQPQRSPHQQQPPQHQQHDAHAVHNAMPFPPRAAVVRVQRPASNQPAPATAAAPEAQHAHATSQPLATGHNTPPAERRASTLAAQRRVYVSPEAEFDDGDTTTTANPLRVSETPSNRSSRRNSITSVNNNSPPPSHRQVRNLRPGLQSPPRFDESSRRSGESTPTYDDGVSDDDSMSTESSPPRERRIRPGATILSGKQPQSALAGSAQQRVNWAHQPTGAVQPARTVKVTSPRSAKSATVATQQQQQQQQPVHRRGGSGAIGSSGGASGAGSIGGGAPTGKNVVVVRRTNLSTQRSSPDGEANGQGLNVDIIPPADFNRLLNGQWVTAAPTPVATPLQPQQGAPRASAAASASGNRLGRSSAATRGDGHPPLVDLSHLHQDLQRSTMDGAASAAPDGPPPRRPIPPPPPSLPASRAASLAGAAGRQSSVSRMSAQPTQVSATQALQRSQSQLPSLLPSQLPSLLPSADQSLHNSEMLPAPLAHDVPIVAPAAAAVASPTAADAPQNKKSLNATEIRSPTYLGLPKQQKVGARGCFCC
jgi:hypothetical protein